MNLRLNTLKQSLRHELFWQTVVELLIEIIITATPIFIIMLVCWLKGDLRRAFQHEEWLIIAAVLFAQSIVKLTRLIRKGNAIKHHWAILWMILIIMFGIIPSALVLAEHQQAALPLRPHEQNALPPIAEPPNAPIDDISARQAQSESIKWTLLIGSIVVFIWTGGMACYCDALAGFRREQETQSK